MIYILLFSTEEEAEQYKNYDLTSIVTLVKVDKLEYWLKTSQYDATETNFLVDGFRNGFDIGYQGPVSRQSQAENIPFTPGVGNKMEMWNKILKEVRAGRVAGPFEQIPFHNYIQSPIGLVAKKGKSKTRLIFHLSYNFPEEGEQGMSLNTCTLRELCSAKYNDLDSAVKNCILMSQKAAKFNEDGKATVYMGKTDASNAFRVLPLKINCICWLVFKAVDPRDGKTKYFVDKFLPFGASISCTHYQHFSNALKHLLQFRTKNGQARDASMNYLDDFLFIAYLRSICNLLITNFLSLCKDLGVPIVEEKTEWASTIVIFLGILLNGKQLTLSLLIEKQEKALRLLNEFSDKKKVTVKQIQVLTGFLNFYQKQFSPDAPSLAECMPNVQQWKSTRKQGNN